MLSLEAKKYPKLSLEVFVEEAEKGILLR